MLTSNASRNRWLWSIAALTALLVLIAFRALFTAYFMLDDFGMLAISRFLENPWQAFYQEHIPGGLYYRPVGMMLWWVSERMFGDAPAPHYLINLGLHLAVSAMLYGVTIRLCERHGPALCAAIAFACHPIGLGTTAWLADRFDLLALLFGLLGLQQALDFSRTGKSRNLWASVLLLGLSLMSKEIAFALIFATVCYWLVCAEQLCVRKRIQAIALLSGVLAVYWSLRISVLPSPLGNSLLAAHSLAPLVWVGITHWAEGFLDNLIHWQRMSGWKLLPVAIGLGMLGVLCVLSLAQAWNRRRSGLLVLGASMMLATALLQWPMLGFFSLPFAHDTPATDVVVNSRYFYTTLAGFLIAVSGLLEPISRQRGIAATSACLALALLVLSWLVADHRLMRQYRNETRIQRAVVQSASALIAGLDLKGSGCQIYLLDTTAPRFGWISDEAIKATYPDLEEIGNCLVQTEHTPWYHIILRQAWNPQAWKPLEFAHGLETQANATAIGRGHFVALNLKPDSTINTGANAHYLSWRGDTFIDISQHVREGDVVPKFLCNRSPPGC